MQCKLSNRIMEEMHSLIKIEQAMVDAEVVDEEEDMVEEEVNLYVTTMDNLQPGHYARDCTNPTTTCKYCQSFEHTIEECPVLLAKMQEKRVQNPNIQLISVEQSNPNPKLNIITRSGLSIEGP